MLTYLINVTGDMLALSLIIGIMLAFMDSFCKGKGKLIYRIGIGVGLIAAGVRAYITNTRRLVGGWKVGAYGYGIALGLFVLTAIILAVFSHWFLKRKEGKKIGTVAEILISSFAGLLTAAELFCAMPNVYAYPFKFDTGGNGILSTDFLFRLGGYLLGLLLCGVSCSCARRLLTAAAKKGYSRLLYIDFCAGNVLWCVNLFAMLMLVLTPRKVIDSPELFDFAAASNNYSYWYTFGVFILLVITAVIFIIGSHTKKEPYSTNAQHRKQRAVWRSGKRSSVVLAVCFVLGILCATWFVELNTVVIREAPIEDPVIEKNASGKDASLVVPIEAVEDGHLHRFGYKTEDGNLVRFIVVLKQENTTNYGVGLDACEICGEAGYYENNNGQIVCKKCNVIMNRTTIGMKGGCNPIIIDYDIDENAITVPVEEMIKNQSHFKS